MFVASQHRPSSAPGPGIKGQFSSFANDLKMFNRRGGLLFGSKTPPPEGLLPFGMNPVFPYARSFSDDPTSSSAPFGPFAPASCSRSPSSVVQEEVHHVWLSEAGSDVESDDAGPSDDPEAASVIEVSFTIEEVGDSYNEDGLIEVIRPDVDEESEDDSSDRDAELEKDTRHMTDRFEDLHCSPPQDLDSDDERARRRYERKKKRWSGGLQKRSHSQSVGSDTDCEDLEALDAHDVGSSARRLRRRVRGPHDRASLVFEDGIPAGIVEVEEPNDDLPAAESGPPSVSSDVLDLSQAWLLLEPMEIELS